MMVDYAKLEAAARLVVKLYHADYDYSELDGEIHDGHCCVCEEGCDTHPIPLHENGCPLVRLAEVLVSASPEQPCPPKPVAATPTTIIENDILKRKAAYVANPPEEMP